MSPECVCEVLAQYTPQIFLYSMLKLSIFEGLQKRTGPLNANELLQRAELQELVFVSCVDYLTQTHTNDRNCSPINVKTESVKDGETQEEVTTCRIQQDVSERLVDEFMLLMWS